LAIKNQTPTKAPIKVPRRYEKGPNPNSGMAKKAMTTYGVKLATTKINFKKGVSAFENFFVALP